MQNLYIKVGSITNAQRGQRLLRSKGYKSQIRKTENPAKSDGCGYELFVRANGDAPVNILEDGGIEIRGVEKR
ncbi:MAG: hypothetical protein ACI4V4_02145 [Eubacterium sp.]